MYGYYSFYYGCITMLIMESPPRRHSMENKAFHHGSAQEVAQAHQAPRQSDLEDLEGPVFYAKKKNKNI